MGDCGEEGQHPQGQEPQDALHLSSPSPAGCTGPQKSSPKACVPRSNGHQGQGLPPVPVCIRDAARSLALRLHKGIKLNTMGFLPWPPRRTAPGIGCPTAQAGKLQPKSSSTTCFINKVSQEQTHSFTYIGRLNGVRGYAPQGYFVLSH